VSDREAERFALHLEDVPKLAHALVCYHRHRSARLLCYFLRASGGHANVDRCRCTANGDCIAARCDLPSAKLCSAVDYTAALTVSHRCDAATGLPQRPCRHRRIVTNSSQRGRAMRCHCRALFVGTECNRQSMRSAAPRKAQRNISSMRRTIKYVNDMPTAAAQQQVNQSKPSSAAQLTAAL